MLILKYFSHETTLLYLDSHLPKTPNYVLKSTYECPTSKGSVPIGYYLLLITSVNNPNICVNGFRVAGLYSVQVEKSPLLKKVFYAWNVR